MDQHLFKYLQLVLRARAVRIAVISLISYLAILIYIRQMRSTYVAAVTVFVGTPNAAHTPSFSGMPGFGQELSGLEREVFMSSQDALVTSYPVYELTQQKLEDQGIFSKQNSIVPRRGFFTKLQHFILGTDEIVNSQKYQNAGYDVYRTKVAIDQNVAAGAFVLSYQDEDPELALLTLGAVVDSLKVYNGQIANSHASKISEFLKQKMDTISSELQESNIQIGKFVRENNFPKDTSMLASRYQDFYNLKNELEKSEQDLEGSEEILKYNESLADKISQETRRKLAGDAGAKIEILADEIKRFHTNLQQEYQRGDRAPASIAFMNQKLEELRQQLMDEAQGLPELLSEADLKEMLANLKVKIEENRVDVKVKQGKVGSLQKIVTEQQKDIDRFPDLEAKLSQLLVAHTQLEKVRELLMNNYLSSIVQSDVESSRLFVLDEPRISENMLTTNRLKVFLGACFVAIVLISIIVGGIDFLRGVIVSREQLSERDYPKFLGVFPWLSGVKRLDLVASLQGNIDVAKLSYTLNRTISTRVNGQCGIVTFCSEMPLAGKSLSTLALGAGLQKMGKRVLVIDSDFRAFNRHVREYYTQLNSRRNVFSSLSELLTKLKSGSSEVNLEQELIVAMILETGASTGDEMEVIEFFRNEMSGLLNQVKQYFDYIMIDLPPIQFVDSLLMVEKADGIIICCPEAHITESHLQDTLYVIDQHKKRDAIVYSMLTASRLAENHRKPYAYQYQKAR